MAPPDQPSSAKLPVVPDIDQIFNRVSLFVSRAHSQALKSTTASASAASTTSAAAKRGPFSSLTSAGASPQAPRGAYKTAAQHAAEDADFESARNLPPNAGLGFAAPGAGGGGEAARQKREEEFALRRKLGLKGKNGAGVATAGKRGRTEESESEEEMGRSAVGRAKKVKVSARVHTDAGTASKKGRADMGRGSKADEGASEVASKAPYGTTDGKVDAGITANGLPSTAGQEERHEMSEIATKKRKKKRNKKAQAAK